MSYYFTKLYNWTYDIHPYRPTEKETRQKWMITEQIKKTRFKFKNRTVEENKNIPVENKVTTVINYESLNDKIKLLNLIKNKKKSQVKDELH